MKEVWEGRESFRETRMRMIRDFPMMVKVVGIVT